MKAKADLAAQNEQIQEQNRVIEQARQSALEARDSAEAANRAKSAFLANMSLVSQTTCITMNNLLKSTYSFYNAAHHAEIVPIIPTFEKHIGLRDASQHAYMIERGEEAAAKQLPFLRRLLAH